LLIFRGGRERKREWGLTLVLAIFVHLHMREKKGGRLSKGRKGKFEKIAPITMSFSIPTTRSPQTHHERMLLEGENRGRGAKRVSFLNFSSPYLTVSPLNEKKAERGG